MVPNWHSRYSSAKNRVVLQLSNEATAAQGKSVSQQSPFVAKKEDDKDVGT